MGDRMTISDHRKRIAHMAHTMLASIHQKIAALQELSKSTTTIDTTQLPIVPQETVQQTLERSKTAQFEENLAFNQQIIALDEKMEEIRLGVQRELDKEKEELLIQRYE